MIGYYDTYRNTTRMYPGITVTQTWCGVHMDRTDHLYTGSKLICLECHPELRPKASEPPKDDKR